MQNKERVRDGKWDISREKEAQPPSPQLDTPSFGHLFRVSVQAEGGHYNKKCSQG